MKLRQLIRKNAQKYLDLYPYRRYMTQHNCIFVHVPKAAGTSVLHALSGSDKVIQRDHCTIQDFRRANPIRFKQSYKFTFVREPIDRLSSVYRYLRDGGSKSIDGPLSDLIKKSFPTFDAFVDEFMNENMMHNKKLFKPQFSFLCDYDYRVLVDYVGKFESLSEDFLHVSQYIGLNTSLKHKNKSFTEGLICTNATKEKVKHLYLKDYELFYPDCL